MSQVLDQIAKDHIAIDRLVKRDQIVVDKDYIAMNNGQKTTLP